MISLEETFFSIDNTYFDSGSRSNHNRNERGNHFHKKKERANYFQGTDNSSATSSRFTGNCYNCGKSGHLSADCRSTGKKQQNNKNKSNRKGTTFDKSK